MFGLGKEERVIEQSEHQEYMQIAESVVPAMWDCTSALYSWGPQISGYHDVHAVSASYLPRLGKLALCILFSRLLFLKKWAP